MVALPTDIDTTYPDSVDDPSVQLHQQYHDEIHQRLKGVVVQHGSDATMARPLGASVVHWHGTVQPDNLAVDDIYWDETTDLPSRWDGTVLHSVGSATYVAPLGKTSAGAAAPMPSFNVKDYSAVGDGVNDDTTAIQAAVTAASSIGGIVFIPAGTYAVTGTISIDHDSVAIDGDGALATTITTNQATGPVFDVGGNVTLRNYNSIRNLKITASVARTADGFIRSRLTFDLRVDRCRVDGGFIGIDLNNTQSTRISDCHIINCTATTGMGIQADGNGTNLYIDKCATDAPSGTQPLAGIRLGQWDGVWITDTQTDHSGIGLLINPANGQTFQHLFATDCSFDTCSNYGCQVPPVAGNSVRRLWFSGCWFGSNTFHGIALGGGPLGVVFIAPKAVNNGQHGMALSGSDITIIDPFVSGNSTSASGTFSGINVGTMSRVKIIGGDCRPFAGFSDTQAFGINVGSSSADYVIVDSVNCDGNTANAGAGIFFGATGAHSVVRNSSPYCPRGHAVTQPAVPASTVAFTNNTGSDCTVHVTGGTVTVISIGGTATGLTGGSFRVPAGQTIAITYTVAPTWQWFGD